MEKQRCASCFTNENLDEVKDVSTTQNVTGRIPNARAYVDSQENSEILVTCMKFLRKTSN